MCCWNTANGKDQLFACGPFRWRMGTFMQVDALTTLAHNASNRLLVDLDVPNSSMSILFSISEVGDGIDTIVGYYYQDYDCFTVVVDPDRELGEPLASMLKSELGLQGMWRQLKPSDQWYTILMAALNRAMQERGIRFNDIGKRKP